MSTLVRLLVEATLEARVAIMGESLGLVQTENTGVAFGLPLPPSFLAVLLPAIFLVLLWMAFRGKRDRFATIGFGLVLGGALANLLDRLDDGAVTDFLQVGVFPLFNVADSCITVGVAILLTASWRQGDGRHAA